MTIFILGKVDFTPLLTQNKPRTITNFAEINSNYWKLFTKFRRTFALAFGSRTHICNIHRGSFETCVHVNGRSIKAKHKTFTKMEKILRRAQDELKIEWPGKMIRLEADGPVEVRFVPLKKTSVLPLYVSQDGRGFSCSAVKDQETGEVRGFTLRAIKDNQCPTTDPKRKCSSGNYYREFTQKRISVHRAVLLAWVGPCPEGCEADHLNGNNTDNRLCNLQWVTKSENEKRKHTLARLRKLHRAHPELYKDPAKMSRQELLELFAQG